MFPAWEQIRLMESRRKDIPVTHCWGQRTLPQPSLKFSYNLDEVARSKWQNQPKNSHLTPFTVAFFPHSLVIVFFFLFAKHQLDYSLSAVIQTYGLASALCPLEDRFQGVCECFWKEADSIPLGGESHHEKQRLLCVCSDWDKANASQFASIDACCEI